jgi:hypothetical protein
MRGIHTCCPEAPSTINITQNIVEVDGTRALWVEHFFTGLQAKALGYLPLTYSPYARSQVLLMLNSGVQRLGTDFSVNANQILLSFEPADADVLHVKYFALTDGTSTVTGDSSLAVGTLIGYGGTAIPDGWLDMDGTTSHALATYPTLAAWLLVNTDYELSRSATHFVLKRLQSPYYDGTTLVSGKTIIRY